MSRIADDLTGEVFGKLTAFRYLGKDDKSHRIWLCKCECGIVKPIRAGHLLDNSLVSCGCFRNTPRLRPYEFLYNRLLQGKHEVTLTYEEFLEFTKETNCHYCNALVRFTVHIYRDGESPTNLDRKDSALGYSKDNCVVCCKRCNVGKNKNFTYAEWRKIGALICSWAEPECCPQCYSVDPEMFNLQCYEQEHDWHNKKLFTTERNAIWS